MEDSILDRIVENADGEEILKADGFDAAVIGMTSDCVLVYSVQKCVDILIDEGMTHEDALEHLSFNTMGAYVGDKTPIWCIDNF